MSVESGCLLKEPRNGQAEWHLLEIARQDSQEFLKHRGTENTEIRRETSTLRSPCLCVSKSETSAITDCQLEICADI